MTQQGRIACESYLKGDKFRMGEGAERVQVDEMPSAKDGVVENRAKETGRGRLDKSGVPQAITRGLEFILSSGEGPLHH